MIHQTISAGAHFPPIYIGQEIFASKQLLSSHITGEQVLIVTQATIAEHFLFPLQQALQDYQCDHLLLPSGEQHKNMQSWQHILDFLIERKHDRSTTLIALGGGMVGDLTGFAAACYQRGVNFLQIPTTLIAQVDAAIGGKTAINHPSAKNMIGAFHQPDCVIADVSTLHTLPQREYVSGLAEVVKYGLIQDAEFFTWLEANMTALLARETSALLHAVCQSAAIKARIVSEDEKETGVRSLLNFGHTFGHALEAAHRYENILHGEAVAVGMQMATKLSAILGFLSQEDEVRILRLLKKMHLSVSAPIPCVDEMLQLMSRDKKVRDGKMNLILLERIGQAFKASDINKDQIALVL